MICQFTLSIKIKKNRMSSAKPPQNQYKKGCSWISWRKADTGPLCVAARLGPLLLPLLVLSTKCCIRWMPQCLHTSARGGSLGSNVAHAKCMVAGTPQCLQNAGASSSGSKVAQACQVFIECIAFNQNCYI